MKIKKPLLAKFIITYFIFGLLSLITILTLSSELVKDYLTKTEASALSKEANLIANKYTSYFYNDKLSADDVKNQLDAIDTFTGATIFIMNTDGEILYNSSISSSHNEHTTIDAFDPSDFTNHFMVGHFYNTFSDEMLSIYTPMTYNFVVRGYVVIHYPMSFIFEKQQNIILIFLISFGIIFAISVIIFILLTVNIYRPLKMIIKAIEKYASGDMKYSFEEVKSDDEIGYLSAQLKYMATRISQTEDNQKKFIANVSHDFRSPLTSIKGYLEAMADGTIPKEMYEKYIGIVLNETERLTKLTNSLLTLNNLNTEGMLLEISDFDINKTIKDTIATFSGTCKERFIKISLVLTGEELLVHADMGKIQQVLYNLIDNAIKFSDSDSTIKIETTEKNETVFVSVKDEGIGIPKESISHVFDRFYKSDLSRGKDKKGTGLGLSITKEIINAHHENINVISTVGVGTEFIFTLPKSAEDDSL